MKTGSLTQRLRQRRVEKLLGERSVRDAEAHRDPQQVDRGGRRVPVRDRTSSAPARIDRDPAWSGDEEEHRDPKDVDLLEDALDAERDHGDDPEKREDDRGVSRE
jgi:hypothetical protein